MSDLDDLASDFRLGDGIPRAAQRNWIAVRTQALAALKAGQPWRVVAKRFRITVGRLGMWRKAAIAEGAVFPERSPGRRGSTNDEAA